jgi:hypothetical protein
VAIIKLSKRLTLKFLGSLSVLLFFILLVFAGLIYLSRTGFLKQQNGLEPYELLDSISKHTFSGGIKVYVSPSSLKSVDQRGGWLQILGSDGKEIYRYHTPKNIQTSYAPGELLAYRESPSSFGYQIYTWYRATNMQKLTWVYAMPYSERNTYDFMNDYRTWIATLGLSLVIALIIAYIFGLRRYTHSPHVVMD